MTDEELKRAEAIRDKTVEFELYDQEVADLFPKLIAEVKRLREQLRDANRELKESVRDAASQADHAARYPDEPYGTY